MKMPPCRPLTCTALAAVIGVLHSPGSTGQAQTTAVADNPLVAAVRAMAEGEWRRVNENALAEVWTPQHLRPEGAEQPSRIVEAPGGFAWDSNRGDLILYGGGHAAYSGNDTYRWRSRSLRWQRAALPSEIAQLSGTAAHLPIDGADAAPPSARPYGNNVFLPAADRFLTWGGAAFGSGGAYLKPVEGAPGTLRPTGPYLFDPSRADGDKVGGTTGSHVKRSGARPEIVGGNMWSNRDVYGRLAPERLPGGHVHGCAVSAPENGHDVVYVAASEPTSMQLGLYRYELSFIEHAELDRMEQVGSHDVGVNAPTACSYDPAKKVFVRTGDRAAPFLFWDLNTAGAANADRKVESDPSIATFTGWLAANGLSISSCGMDFDAARERHVIWCGKGAVWALRSPSANVAHGWSIEALAPVGGVEPAADAGAAMAGKWKYIPQLDAYLGLVGAQRGDIWVYKPEGWQPPADSDALTAAPAATDDAQSLQATALEAAAVTAVQPVTVTLQQGVNGYQGTADVTLESYHPSLNFGSDPSLKLFFSAYTVLMRFAVFAREGGPVPDGASIQSAKLHIYKQHYNYQYALHPMLKSWSENQATWQNRASGVAWTQPGAGGAGSDYASSADYTLTTGFDPGWMAFDVTARVKAYAAGGANYGWRLRGITGYDSLRYFNASEYTANTTLRPKLVITYTPSSTGSTSSGTPSSTTQGPGLDQFKLPEAALAFYDPSITSSYWNHEAQLPWRRAVGDWYDAAGTLYGTQPYSTVVIDDLDKAQTASVDVTSLVRQWTARTYPNEGLMLRVAPGGPSGSIHFSSREAASGRPTLRLTLSSGTIQTLTAAGDAQLDATTISPLGTRTTFEVAPGKPSVLFFRLPTLQSGVTVTRATLTLTTPVQFSAARVGVYRVTRPLHQATQPVQLGIAAAYPGDVGLEKDPNVLLVEDLRDTNFAARGWWKWSANPEPYGAIVSVADANLGFTPLPGKRALRVTWASNRNGAMDALWGFKQKTGSEPEEIYFRYYLMFAKDWEPTTDGGKLPGFDGRYSGVFGNGGGGWSGTAGWSARGAFERVPPSGNPMHDYPLLGNYVYHADQGGAFGNHVPWPLNGNGYLSKGRWYAIEQYFKVNSIDPATGTGRHDGILRTWVNGRLAYQRTNWRVRDVSSIRIKNIWFNLYHGGTAFPPHDMHTYISQIVIARKYIGPMVPR